MVTWKDNRFYINEEPFQIMGGSIHYFRSTPDKWYDLLLKLKNCGLNTVETYCAWNLHEPEPGVYDFSGRLDLDRFIKTAKDLGLYVVLRPGPYICAEWEFGGLPAWLLKDRNMRVRIDDGEYLTYVKRYFDHLMPHILPHLETRGGNVILMAAENEYGSFGNNTKYMNQCAQMLRDYGVDVPIFTSDGHTKMFLDGGHADGCLCALDFGYDKGELNESHTADLMARQPDAPPFHVEFWIGMFSHWGEPAQSYPPEYVAEEVKKHLEQGVSFILYMFHGGTNFGFMNGANYFNRDEKRILHFTYHPDVTSYDYDSLLNEWGEITPKYLAVQKVMEEHFGVELPKADPIPLLSLGEIALDSEAELFANLEQIGTKFETPSLYHMEHFGQSYGYILYRAKIEHQNATNVLAVNGLADLAYIFFNGEYKGMIHRNDNDPCLQAPWLKDGGVLDILVENQGRVNFGASLYLGERKGILENVVMYGVNGPGQNIFQWETYTLPMDNLSKLSFGPSEGVATDGKMPMFYKGTFQVEEAKDCFVHLENFEKGFVVVNGFNLGRYWNVGPQQSLYLPASVLKEENEILVFSDKKTENPVVSIRDYHILDSMTTDKNPETIM